jgi:RecG-like helicase
MSIDPIFAKYLSKSQIQNLKIVGINSVYDLLTFLPFSLENLQPIASFFGTNYINPSSHLIDKEGQTKSGEIKTKYLMDAQLVSFTRNQGKTGQAYFYLSFCDGDRTINTYYFASSPYAAKNLIIGNQFQLILINSNNLWSIEKIVESKVVKAGLSRQESVSAFKLGESIIQKYLLPKYSKTGFLQSGFFAQVFLQIPRQFFQLNLQALVPENPIIPGSIDFWNIHHPESMSKYHATMQQWIGLRVFLKLALIKYIDINKEKKYAKSSNIDLDFLKNISSNLPFELSNTQKTAIWSILSEVSPDQNKI